MKKRIVDSCQVIAFQQPDSYPRQPGNQSLLPGSRSHVGKNRSLVEQSRFLVERNQFQVEKSRSHVGKNQSQVEQNRSLMEQNRFLVEQNRSLMGKNRSLEGKNRFLVGEKAIPGGEKSIPNGAKSIPGGTKSIPRGEKWTSRGEKSFSNNAYSIFRITKSIPGVEQPIHGVKALLKIKITGECKMNKKKKPLANRLVNARLALTNALAETEIKEALKELGFDETKLQSGMNLLERVENLYREQKWEYSSQYAATGEFNKILQEAVMVYRKYRTAARLAFLDAPALENALGLNSGPIYNIPEWLTQARLFYSGALESPEVLEKLKEFAITAENLEAGLDLVTKAQEFHNRQQIESSEAKQATRERNAAVAELDLFMRKFKKVAWVLLADKPKYLEKLGIPEYYGRSRRKKQDTEPAEPKPTEPKPAEPKPAEPVNTEPATAKTETAAASPGVQEVPAVSKKNRQPARVEN